MGKVVSYRQKLIELAKIYKINKVFDLNVKLTTYDIEILLLKNNITIPQKKRGYISHKLINEVVKPLYEGVKKKISINININKYLRSFHNNYRKKLSISNYISKLSIDVNINKYLKNFFNGIESYFKFKISSIFNFFKILTKTVIETLNDVYNFKVSEKILKNIFSKGIYASLVAILVFSGFYIKDLVVDMDSVKISLEITPDKSAKEKNLKKKK